VKPVGTIPADYQAVGSELAIAGRPLSQLLADAGDTPLFVYDGSIIRARVAALRETMPEGLAIHYAIKANPHPDVLALLAGLVDGFDVASAGELARSLAADAPAISFAGPGKRDHELAVAIEAGATINLESEAEAERALRIAAQAGQTPKLAVRVNPDFAITGAGLRMAGGARPFGVDAERVPALVRRLRAADADWRGFHLFLGSQSLDADAIAAAQAATVALVASLADEIGATPPDVSLGGGFGIPISPANGRSTSAGSARPWARYWRRGQRSSATPASPLNSAAGWSARPAFTLPGWLIGRSAMVRPS
jgi:diaminopimelate decarboxylase